MKFATRSRPVDAPPGLVGTARVERRVHALASRLKPGDVAVIDHLDLDRASAHLLADAGVVAVVNAAAMISGRYANLGPEVLTGAGIAVVDRAGPGLLAAVRDGKPVRVHEGVVYVDGIQVAVGQVLDAATVAEQMTEARDGMAAHLGSFTHNSTEFLRREQDLLLHGRGVPRTQTRIEGRPVVVVVPGHQHREELRGVRSFIRETDPVLIGVDRGADALLAAGHPPHIVVVNGADHDRELPTAQALKAARDVVVRLELGAPGAATASLGRMGIHALTLETGATSEDVALIVADRGGASVIVGVGMHATLEEFLDRQHGGLASTFLTRLAVGPRLVDAAAVPQLYSGRIRPRHLLGVTLAGLVALVAAVATTPVGQSWVDDAGPAVGRVVDDVQGWLS